MTAKRIDDEQLKSRLAQRASSPPDHAGHSAPRTATDKATVSPTLGSAPPKKGSLVAPPIYHIRYQLLIWIARHGTIAGAILLLVLIGFSAFWIPALRGSLEPLFATEERLQGLRSFFLTLGGALLGAAAIVSSLVLFSMQVNVERMPHGLFPKLSADRRLLSAFAAAFLLAVFIAVLSLIPNARLTGMVTFGAFWATWLILFLFFLDIAARWSLSIPFGNLASLSGI